MATFRAVQFPQGRPTETTPMGAPFTAEAVVEAGSVAAELVGTPETGTAYWLEYADAQGRWQSARAVVGEPPSA